MSKSKLSLEDSITLAQNNAIDFTHACVTIALNEKFGIGKERQKKVNAVRDEVNGKVLEIMTRPASRKHEPLRKALCGSCTSRWPKAGQDCTKSGRCREPWTARSRWSGGCAPLPVPRCWGLVRSG